MASSSLLNNRQFNKLLVNDVKANKIKANNVNAKEITGKIDIPDFFDESKYNRKHILTTLDNFKYIDDKVKKELQYQNDIKYISVWKSDIDNINSISTFWIAHITFNKYYMYTNIPEEISHIKIYPNNSQIIPTDNNPEIIVTDYYEMGPATNTSIVKLNESDEGFYTNKILMQFLYDNNEKKIIQSVYNNSDSKYNNF